MGVWGWGSSGWWGGYLGVVGVYGWWESWCGLAVVGVLGWWSGGSRGGWVGNPGR